MKKSIALKIIVFTAVSVSLILIFQVGIYFFTVNKLSGKLVYDQFNAKTESDLNSYFQYAQNYLGELSVRNGRLVSEKRVDLYSDHSFVDKISEELGVAATVFAADGDDFVRISTSIRNAEGERVIGTKLGKDSSAYKPVVSGERYIGEANILGRDYVTGYAPVFDENGRAAAVFFLGVYKGNVKRYIAGNIKVSLTVFILITVFFNTIGFVILYIIIRRILKPLSFAGRMLREISEGNGDLTKRINVSVNDEVGRLASYFNDFLVSLNNMIVKIKTTGIYLNDTSDTLSVSMEETSSAINEIVAHIESVKHLVESQMKNINLSSEKLNKITQNIDSLNFKIEDQSASVIESSTSIEQMVSNIKSVSHNLDVNSKEVDKLLNISELGRDKINNLNSLITDISKSSEVLLETNLIINNISSQTNLLAMNAAIEAAHAGEYGKGFAVVADEIRKLAESSANQSKSISALLSEVKKSIDSVSALSEDSEKTFHEILSITRSVSNLEKEINNAMKEQTAGSSQLLTAISQINYITQEVKNSSGEMLSELKSFSAIMTDSRKMSEEINHSMSEMSNGTKEINIAATHVAEISVKNSENVSELMLEINRFKTDDSGKT